MSLKTVQKSGLSTSGLSAKNKTKKIRRTQNELGESLTQYDGQEEVVSGPSNSRLGELYKTPAFQIEWANDVRFHVARNLLHLRRHRGKSQDALAREVGTSQSAIARIESGRENVTVDTIGRIVANLGGRFYISIPPAEFQRNLPVAWWEIADEGKNPWTITHAVGRKYNDMDQVIVGFERASTSTMPILIANGSTAEDRTSD